MERFKETQELLESIKRNYSKLCENGEKESSTAKDLKEDIDALEMAIRLLQENKY